MMQELNDTLKLENNRLRSSFDRVGEESSAVMDKLRELAAQADAGAEERARLERDLEGARAEAERLRGELRTKAEQLGRFTDALNQIKASVDSEKVYNGELGLQVEALTGQLQAKEAENLRLSEFNEVAKMTIAELEKKIDHQQRDLDDIMDS